jgi:hypothetical protein
MLGAFEDAPEAALTSFQVETLSAQFYLDRSQWVPRDLAADDRPLTRPKAPR